MTRTIQKFDKTDLGLTVHCSDDTLFAWRPHEQRWQPLKPVPQHDRDWFTFWSSMALAALTAGGMFCSSLIYLGG